jgi:predicted Zn-dependent protease
MKTIIAYLNSNPKVTDYKIRLSRKESYESFYVKGKLETVRCTDTCDKIVTVYVDHGEFKGDSQFYVYPSTTSEELAELIEKAVEKASLLNNKMYTLPENETGEYEVESNFSAYTLSGLSKEITEAVFSANNLENADLNSVEVFVNRHTDTVCNSRGIHKTQVRYDAMVEAIPTFNGESESVELYQQYNFSAFCAETVKEEIAQKLREVKARASAVKPDFSLNCKVILNKQELGELFGTISYDLNFSTVYSHANLYHKGDDIQADPTGDKVSITMAGSVPGNIRSAHFDGDGMTLKDTTIVKDGKAVAYYGANRFGQYLEEVPTGNLRCIQVAPGSACAKCLTAAPYLEVLSMSGLQVDPFNDYIGGEIRLAYYCDGEKTMPVTGISITGSLKQVLSSIRLSTEIAAEDGYTGPAKAILQDMKIF